MKIGIFLRNLDEILSEFHEHLQKMSRIFNFLKKKDQIFRKIRENFGNVQIIQKIIQHYSVVSLIWKLAAQLAAQLAVLQILHLLGVLCHICREHLVFSRFVAFQV